jgi:hypothetical protein
MVLFAAAAITRTVFVITDQLVSVWPFARSLMYLAILCGALYISRRIPRQRIRRTAYIGLLDIGFIVFSRLNFRVASALPFIFRTSELDAAIQQYEHGNYQTVEGTVSGYKYIPEKARSCFLVDQTEVCSYASTLPIGYHRNGETFVVRDGMRVKVFYHEPLIFRIDLVE